jgi:hypothetical protein
MVDRATLIIALLNFTGAAFRQSVGEAIAWFCCACLCIRIIIEEREHG